MQARDVVDLNHPSICLLRLCRRLSDSEALFKGGFSLKVISKVRGSAAADVRAAAFRLLGMVSG
jgi:hypothetical protein